MVGKSIGNEWVFLYFEQMVCHFFVFCHSFIAAGYLGHKRRNIFGHNYEKNGPHFSGSLSVPVILQQITSV